MSSTSLPSCATSGSGRTDLRYLWTDAFGVVLLVSLYEELKDERYLDEAEWLVAEVMRVLGRKRGIRIGEEADRDGQYFHYLSMWLYALCRARPLSARTTGSGVLRLRAQIHDPSSCRGAASSGR